jgi:MSHA biogenesis protein MshJ
MTAILRDLLAGQQGLELVSLRSTQAEDLMQGKASGTAGIGIYRHGIEISVRGSYADLTRYMRQIEALPWKVLPGRLIIKTETYPQSTMTLTLYTLSLERAWLSF